MDDTKLIELAEDVAGLKVGMASIEDKLDALIRTLNGNGQPGVISQLQSRDATLTARMDRFENKIQWLTGIWVGGSGVVMVLFAIVEFLHRR